MGLTITDLSKRFTRAGQEHLALNAVSFQVPKGAFVTLLGPSGCGKSTLLNMIAGLDRPTSGRVEIGGKLIYDSAQGVFVAPGHRNISMVFQSYAIWPHLTVEENVEFPLKHGRKKFPSAAARKETTLSALKKVHLEEFKSRPAPLLSGGQQQRVSLARAIAQSPAVILLDEPLSNLDSNLRDAMQKEIKSIVSGEGITAVYVTHDQKEALSMSDTVIVMNAGNIEQIGTPYEVYYQPKTRFVANFMGAPNLVDAVVYQVDHEARSVTVNCMLGQVTLPLLDGETKEGDSLTFVLKQEDFLVNPDQTIQNRFDLQVLQKIFLGERMELVCAPADNPEHQLSIYVSARLQLDSDRVTFGYKTDQIHYFQE